MLSSSSRPYIVASVPVLQKHGLTISQRFYHSMFTAHPELRNLFNMGNQANGSQQQSLAAAVFAYAANIDHSAALGPVIERICHKHAAVGIKPEHYPIVGRHLLQAIADTLGSSATAGLMQAWDEAYWLLAGELIATEAQLYQTRGVTAGSMQQVIVSRIEKETNDTISLYLQTKNLTSPGSFKPGQYISVLAHFDEYPEKQLRQYSLSDAIQQPWWRITVKREMGNKFNGTPEGRVSNWLHENIRIGDELAVSAAYGDFTPDLTGKKPLVLLAAGVGITPMQSIINTLCLEDYQHSVWFGYAAKTSDHHAFKTELNTAKASLSKLQSVSFYEDQTGRMELTTHALPLDGNYYICGPHAFMRTQWASLLTLGIQCTQIHREVFGPELLDHLLQVSD